MKIKREMIIISLIICMLFTISSVCAVDSDLEAVGAQNTTDEAVSVVNDDNLDDVYSQNAADIIAVSDENSLQQSDANEKLAATDAGTATALFSKISTATAGSTVYLENDYNWGTSTTIITVSKSLTIDGQGHIIDLNSKTRAFTISNNVTLKNIIFKNGYHSSQAGVIYWQSSSFEGNIVNCTFNDAKVASGKNGGSILVTSGKVNIINSTFNNNVAGTGGAIYIGKNAGSVNLNNCIFNNNQATSSGSAIYIAGTSNPFTITCSIFINNKASSLSSTVHRVSTGVDVISNSIFLNNTGNNNKIHTTGAGLTANNNWFGNTVEDNTKPTVSPYITMNNWYVLNMAVNDALNKATLSLNNLYDGTNFILDDDYNLPVINFTITCENITLPKNNVAINSNGEGSFDFYIDEPTSLLTASYNVVSFTKNFEVDLSDDGSITSLNNKIQQVISNNQNKVKLFNNYAYDDAELVTNLFNQNGIGIATDFTIDGQGFTIDGKNKGGRIIYFKDATKDLILENINFVNCKDAYGSAVYVTCRNLEIINCTFSDGTATGNPGAAIYANVAGHYKIINSSFTNNQITVSNKNGGAIAMYASSATTGEITDCNFINNRVNYRGGAIFLNNAAGGDTLDISRCIFKGNTAANVGSSLYLNSLGNYKLTNSIILDEGNVIFSRVNFGIDNNWWGSTSDDYSTFDVDVRYGNNNDPITVNKWLYLDLEVDNLNSVSAVSLNKLNDGTIYSDYDLPNIALNIQGVNATLSQNTISLENGQTTVPYEIISKKGSLTVSYDDISVTKPVKLYIIDSFSSLKDQIDESGDSTLTLTQNYIYNAQSDSELTNGIEIIKDMTIDGAGYTIDAKGLSNIFYFNDDTSTKNLILKNIIFANSTAQNGAAVYFKGNKIEIINCTFLNNTADNGDAVYIADAKSTDNKITQSTFMDNVGSNSVVYVNLDSADAKLSLDNSVFIGNDATYNVKASGNVNADYNWWGNTKENYNTNIAKSDGVSVNNWLFAKLDAVAASKGTATLTLNNLYDGQNSTYADYSLPSVTFSLGGTDTLSKFSSITVGETGQARYAFAMYKTTATLTAGLEDITTAKELEFVLVDDGSFQALNDIIWFAEGDIELNKDYSFIEGVDTITGGIPVTKAITINGNGHTVDAKGKAAILWVQIANVALKNISFVNGVSDYGGAIYSSSESLDIDNCSFINNRATAYGGAICSWPDDGGMGSIKNSVFINNSAPKSGGAIFNYGWANDFSDTIDKCVFVNNTASSYILYLYGPGSVKNSVFVNNTASYNFFTYYTNSVTFTNNWFGNTFDDKNIGRMQHTYYNQGNYPEQKWMYLDIKFYEDYALISLDNRASLYDDYGKMSDYNLQELTLNVNSTTLELGADKVTLNSNGKAVVPYTLIGDTGALTVSYNGISLTKDRVLGDFDSLQTLVNKADANSVIKLDKDYTYTDGIDDITKGIVIAKNLTIDGQGHTIDAKGKSGIFLSNAQNITFKNIRFANGSSYYERGSAIYYYGASSVDFNVINCTFVNNKATDNYSPAWAYGGGAIYLSSKDGTYNIKDSKFFNNSALSSGGAIYSEVTDSDGGSVFNINNCTFLKNSADNVGGAILIYSQGFDYKINYSTFVSNSVGVNDGSAIYFYAQNSQDSIVNNNIFLNKKGLSSFTQVLGDVNLDNNWWGLNSSNYNDFSSIGYTEPDSWIFLNATVSASEIYLNDAVAVKYRLQSYNKLTGEITDVDYSKLPLHNLNISAIKGSLNKNNVFFDEDVTYNATEIGLASVTANYEGYKYTIQIKNKQKSVITLKNDTVVLYVWDTPDMSNFVQLSHSGTLNFESSNTTLVTVYSNTLRAYSKEGTAVISVSYDGDDYSDSAQSQFTVKVIKVPLIINITNYNSDNINITVGNSINLTFELKVDMQGENYHTSLTSSVISSTLRNLEYLRYTTEVNKKYDVSTDSLIKASIKSTEISVENNIIRGNMTVEAKRGGNLNLSFSYNDHVSFNLVNKTLNITVKRIPTEITFTTPEIMEIKVGDLFNVAASVNVTGGNVEYRSSDSVIAMIASTNGEGLANGEGTALITARYNGNATHENSSNTVTVKVSKWNTEINITSSKDISLKVDDSSKITAKIESEDDHVLMVIVYESSDENVATVDAAGKIKAVGEGNAVITVRYDGDVRWNASSDTVQVTVSKIPSSITVNTRQFTADVFENRQILAYIYHDEVLGHEKLTFTSNDESIVTVGSDGKLTAVSGGIANITVSYNGDYKYEAAEDVNVSVKVNKLSSEITVSPAAEVDVDSIVNLDARAANGRDEQLQYISSNPDIVTVDENGKITGATGGKANITVRYSEDGQYLSNEVNVSVTVKKLPTIITVNKDLSVDIGGSADINAAINSDGELSYSDFDNSVISVDGNLITGIKSGETAITVHASETDRYMSNHTTVNVIVRYHADINVIVNNVTAGEDANAFISISSPLTGNVTVTLKDESGNILTKNITSSDFISKSDLPVGNYYVNVKYAGDEKFLRFDITEKFTVCPVYEFEFTADVNDTVVGEITNVTVKLPADAKGKLIINGSEYPISDKIALPAQLKSGLNNVSVKYVPENSKYAQKEIISYFNVDKKDSSLTVSADEIIVGEKAVIRINIDTDAIGTVIVNVNGTEYSLNLPKTTLEVELNKPGEYKLNATYLGDAIFNPNRSETVILKVADKKTPSITISDISNVKIGKEFTFTVGADNAAVKINGETLSPTGKTYKYTPQNGDDLTLTVEIEENRTHYANTEFRQIKVNKNEISVGVTADSVNAGEKTTVKVTLNVDDAKGIVIVSVNGNKYSLNISNTNELGVVLDKAGTYRINATYLGDDKYLSNISDTIEVTAQEKLTNSISSSINSDGSQIKATSASGEDVEIYIDGKMAGVNTVITTLTAGNHFIEFKTKETKDYKSNSTSQLISIAKKQPTITITHEGLLTAGSYGKINIKTDSTAKLNVLMDGQIFDYIKQFMQTAGKHLIVATVLENDEYFSASENFTFTVSKLDVNIDVGGDHIVAGEKSTISVIITQAVTGIVIVNVNGTQYYLNLTESDSFDVVLNTPGIYSLSAKYLGDDRFNEKVSAEKTIIVADKKAADISVAIPDTIYAGDNIFIDVTSQSTADLKVLINGEDYPISNGEVVIENISAGEYIIEVTSPENNQYKSDSFRDVFTAVKRDSNLNIDILGEISINKKFDVLFISYAGAEITVYLDGVKQTLNGNILAVNPSAGVHTIVASVDESDRYYGASANRTFTVSKLTPSVKISAADTYEGEKTRITADTDISEGIVIVKIDGSEYAIDLSQSKSVDVLMNKAGKYDLTGEYLGSDTYNSLTLEKSSVTVTAKETPEVTVTVPDIKAGESGNIEISVPDSAGNVTVIVDGAEQTLPLENGNASVPLDNTDAGKHSVTVVYSGDDKNAPGVASKTFEISKQSSEAKISVPQNLKEGDSAKIEVNVGDIDGKVHIIVDGKDNVAELSGGKAGIEIADVSAGTHTIVAVFDGDKNHELSYAVSHFDVKAQKHAEKLASEFSQITITDDFKIKGVLKDGDGNVIADAKVNYSAGSKQGTVTTSSDGSFTVSASAGSVVKLSYGGNDRIYPTDTSLTLNSAVSEDSRLTTQFNITEGQTISTYAVDFNAGEKGKSFKFQLTDSQGNPVANATVQFAYKTVIFNRTTDANGIVSLGVSTQFAGSYLCALSYLGDADHEAAFVAFNFKLDKKTLKVSAPSKTYKSGVKTKKYTVTFKTSKFASRDGKVYLKSGKKVTLKIGGKTYAAKINKKGQATFKITKLTKKGKYTGTIKYSGDVTYKAVSKKCKITVK